jgi:hypothetical protein
VISGASAVNTRVHFLLPFRTRGCGCIGRPAFPTPSVFRGPGNRHRFGRIAPRDRGRLSAPLFDSSIGNSRDGGGDARGRAADAVRSRQVAAPRVAAGEAWCPWPESNQHSLRNSILSRARLPVPPQGHSRVPGRKGRGRRSGRTIAGGRGRSTRADVIFSRLDRRSGGG